MSYRSKIVALCSSVVLAACAGSSVAADTGLRVVTWNISNYSGGAQSSLETAFFDTYQGRTLAPDLLVVQEILSQSAVNSMLTILNNAPSSPGDYAAGPFTNGRDTDNGMFYRTSKLTFLSTAILPADPGTTGAPRDVNRYDLKLVGYEAPGAVISIYSSHMKAGSSSSSQARRLIESQKIRADAETLDPAWNIMLGADFNIQSSSQAAYQYLINSQANNNGRFADPIGTPGNWNNSYSYRFVHTQDPAGGGGMDDRLDQLLVDPSLGDGQGMEYKGAFGVPYSTTTWNDLNHSYRSYGNDGTTFNDAMEIANNSMVGPTIASALVALASGSGHLPVFADFIVPGVIDADAAIDLGTIPVGTIADVQFLVGNGGDTALWGIDGINTVEYTLETDFGFTVDAGSFSDAAGGAMNTHTVSFDASAEPFGSTITGEVRVLSNDLDTPILVIPVIGQVGGCSAADLSGDGIIDIADVFAFLNAYNSMDSAADLTGDGTVDISDVFAFLDAYNAGCP